jgi:cytochrome P450
MITDHATCSAVAIGTLVRRYPHMRLADGEVRWRDSVTLRGLFALPLQLEPTGSTLA